MFTDVYSHWKIKKLRYCSFIVVMNWIKYADRFRLGKSKIYITNLGGREVTIEIRQQIDKSYKWVVKMDCWVLGKDNKYYYEPMPSSRTDEFIDNTRFGNKESAFMAFQKHEGGHPQPLTFH